MSTGKIKGKVFGLVACALSVGLAFSPLSVAHADPAEDYAAPVVSADLDTDRTMNYAVNLDNATGEQFQRAVELVDEGDTTKLLATYPEIGTFFVQSSLANFASSYAQTAAEAGVPLHSVGPTRNAEVKGAEVITEKPLTQTIRNRRSADLVVSQLDREAALAPDPATVERNWGLYAIHAIEAAELDRDWAPVVVGIFDTGIDASHPDLAAKVNADLSVGCDNNGLIDHAPEAWASNHYHGTHVAGTVAAAMDGEGIQGVAPMATLAAVRVANGDGMFYPEYVTCGFMWSAEAGMDVTNHSYYVDPWYVWEPTDPRQTAGLEAVTRAADYAAQHDVLAISAAGNEDFDLDNYVVDSESPNDSGDDAIEKDRPVPNGVNLPAELNDVISVSSVAYPRNENREFIYPVTEAGQHSLEKSGFSNWGQESIDIAAPGSSIYSTFPMDSPYGTYATISGTSMASPHVAGVAALVKSAHPDWTARQVTEALLNTADRSRLLSAVGAEDGLPRYYEGHGLVDALAAVDYAFAPAVDPIFTFSPRYLRRNQNFTMHLAGFAPRETLVFTALGGHEDQSWNEYADENGKLSGSHWYILADAKAGDYVLQVHGETSGITLTQTFTILELDSPELTVDKPKALPGDSVTVTGKGFNPNEAVSLYIYVGEEQRLLFQGVADENGVVTATFEVPQLANGEYKLVAVGEDSLAKAEAVLTLGLRALPATGVGVGSALPALVLVSVAGAAALAAKRR